MDRALRERFRWKTREGHVLSLEQMSTRHIFNAMKMLYNHLAHQHNGRTVWYQHTYCDKLLEARRSPRGMASTVVLFIDEIEQRGDLPDKYVAPYLEILVSIGALREQTLIGEGSRYIEKVEMQDVGPHTLRND